MNARTLFGPDSPCICCGAAGHTTVDHIQPRGMGGSNDRTNLAPSCQRCNHVKSTLEAERVREYTKARSRGQEKQMQRIVETFLRDWPRYCLTHSHGLWLPCRCGACLAAPIPFGAATVAVEA